MNNFWNALDKKEKRKIHIIIALIITGIIMSVFFLLFGDKLQFLSFRKEDKGEVTTDSNRDKEKEDFYEDKIDEDNNETAYENEYAEEILELLTKFTDEGVNGKKNNTEDASITSVTALNGSFVEDLNDLTEKELNHFLEEQGVEKKKYKNYSLSDKKMLYLGFNAYTLMNKSYTIEKKSNKEYKYKGNEFDSLLLKYQNQNYQTVVDEVSSIAKKNNLTSKENKLLASLYADLALMKDFGKMKTVEDKKNILRGHKNPVALAIDTLYVSPRLRESVIVKTDSLSPFLEGFVTVKSYSRVNNNTDTFKYHCAEYDMTVNLYEIILEADDGKEMVCYVRQDSNGVLTIDGYYDHGEPTGYRTVQFWIDEGLKEE